MTVLSQLTALLGDARVLTDPASLALYSGDVFFWDDGGPKAIAVARPRNTADVASIATICAVNDVSLAPRGGGVSYTKGYTPARADTVIVDVGALNAIEEINATDRYITVGAGCTWQALADALHGTGLRTVARGPISGTFATVGGTASQNTGGDPMSGYIGLEVVLTDSRVLRTGSAAATHAGGFFRNYGPDLTGLFLGDTGAFGLKTKCTLALEAVPKGVAFASAGFNTLTDMARVMTRVAETEIACRMLGMDPVKNRTATKVDVKEGLQTLAKIVTGSGSVFAGLKKAASVASAGKGVLDNVPWSLHFTVEGHDQAAADHALSALMPLLRDARILPPSVPTALHAKPYSIRGIVGMNGERWVPVHGVFALSKVEEAVQQTEAFFAAHAGRLAAHGIDYSFLTVCNGPAWVIEPMFYWFDQLGPLHAHVLGDKFARFKDIPANPAARSVVKEMRGLLATLFQGLGALNGQLGKYYNFAGNIDPVTYDALTTIKNALDPHRRLNTGNLGWG